LNRRFSPHIEGHVLPAGGVHPGGVPMHGAAGDDAGGVLVVPDRVGGAQLLARAR